MPFGAVDDVLKFPRRARQPIDVPADDRVDLTGRDVSKQPLPFGSAFAAKPSLRDLGCGVSCLTWDDGA